MFHRYKVYLSSPSCEKVEVLTIVQANAYMAAISAYDYAVNAEEWSSPVVLDVVVVTEQSNVVTVVPDGPAN